MKCLILKQSSIRKREETKRPLDTTYQMTYYEVKDKKEIKHLGWFMNFDYVEQLDTLLKTYGHLTLEYRLDLNDGELPLRVLTIEDG